MTDPTNGATRTTDHLRASRRQVLSFAGLVLGTGIVQVAGPTSRAAAAPTTADLTLEPIANDPVTVLYGDSPTVQECPRQLALKVVNGGVALPSGTRLMLTFDPRLYAPMERALVTLGNRSVPASTEITTDADSGTRTCTITLHESVPQLKPGQDALVAVVGTARPLLYPRDLVRRTVTTSAEMPATSRSPQRTTSLQPMRIAASGGTRIPWGIELGGIWGRHTWAAGEKFRYYYPVQLTMRSVGPGAVPSPPSFTVALDPRLVREISISWVRLNGKKYSGTVRRLHTSRTTAVYETRWRTPTQLKAGDVLDFGLQASLLKPPGALPTIKHPVVVLDSMDGDVSQRQTGLNTFARLDSVWQS
jgi:hypothetical protein